MKHITFALIILAIIGLAFLYPGFVNASEGLPGSAKFGFGAVVNVNGEYMDQGIEIASSIGMDWIAVEFDWEEMWHEPNSPPNISVLSDAITRANQSGLSVLLTISNPAEWATTELGPDPQTTANLILSLVNFFQDKVQAIELFPGVNTYQGWKAKPNPQAYLSVLRMTQDTLKDTDNQITIITTFTPTPTHPSGEDVDDLTFLADLYHANARPFLTIIGVKFNHLSGDPYSNPGPSFLRHYEELRSVMLNNNHSEGTIWVTGFSWPIRDYANGNVGAAEESDWVEKAYSLMRAQLYIGAAFFNQINPYEQNNETNTETSLLYSNTGVHPAVDRIKQLIIRSSSNPTQKDKVGFEQNQSNSPKSSNNTYLTILLKKHVRQNDFKNP